MAMARAPFTRTFSDTPACTDEACSAAASPRLLLTKFLCHITEPTSSRPRATTFDRWIKGETITLILFKNGSLVAAPHQRSSATPQATLQGKCRLMTLNPAIGCLLYTSDAADDLRWVDLGGRRIIK